MKNIMDSFFGGWMFDELFDNSFSKWKEYEEDDRAYSYRVSAPGFEEKDLKVEVATDRLNRKVLTVTGKKEERNKFVSSDLRYSFHLPLEADETTCTAEYQAGVLVVSFNKKEKILEENCIKQIPIKTK